ncbi:LacI family DNA-binding transcriptional regulator, partial [Mycobacterium tuberculosis]|nr:LacI family DNA-binding transcriptional regulator [Mycobacterium tuberculosis]
MNLKELSEHLGLSKTTVSRALNGFSDVSEETRRRVEEAARRFDYTPNASAKQLATGRAGPETDAMLAACLPAIADCHDCADFLLVPLLWCRISYADAI